jgi:hypothetical protein
MDTNQDNGERSGCVPGTSVVASGERSVTKSTEGLAVGRPTGQAASKPIADGETGGSGRGSDETAEQQNRGEQLYEP